MLKMMVLIDGHAVTAFDFEKAAEEAAADGFEFYDETFGVDAESNLDFVDVKVEYAVTGEKFDVRCFLVMNPFAPVPPDELLGALCSDIAKHRVAGYLTELEEKKNDFIPRFKRARDRRQKWMDGLIEKPEDIDDIPF